MKCPVCGKEIPDNSKYCPYCGAQVQKEETVVEEELPSSGFTSKRKQALILTLFFGIYGIILLLISLLFGMGWHLLIIAATAVFYFIFMMGSLRKVELSQKELDRYNELYGFKNGKQTQNYIASVEQAKGLTRQNIYLIAIGKKGLGILSNITFAFGLLGLVLGIGFPVMGLGGIGLNLDGVYVQSTSHASSGGASQVGSTAYKIDGNNIYFAGIYNGENTSWGSAYSYSRFGNKVTYTFTGGGMNSTHELYFVNFANNIAADRFGFDIQFTRTSVK